MFNSGWSFLIIHNNNNNLLFIHTLRLRLVLQLSGQLNWKLQNMTKSPAIIFSSLWHVKWQVFGAPSNWFHLWTRQSNSAATSDKRESSFLFQRLSIELQNGYAACVVGALPSLTPPDWYMLLHVWGLHFYISFYIISYNDFIFFYILLAGPGVWRNFFFLKFEFKNNNNTQLFTCHCSINQLRNYELQSIDSLNKQIYSRIWGQKVARDLRRSKVKYFQITLGYGIEPFIWLVFKIFYLENPKYIQYGSENSTSTGEVARFHHLFPNPSWLT